MSVSAPADIELVESMMDLIESADRPALSHLIERRAHPEIEWVPLIAAGIEGEYHGKDRVRRFLDDLLDSFEVSYDERELRSLGERVVLALCRMDLRGRESGFEITTPVGTVYEFDPDGMIRRGRVFDDQSAAIAAAEALAAEESN